MCKKKNPCPMYRILSFFLIFSIFRTVLLIHFRIGRNNWSIRGKKIIKNFFPKVPTCFDSGYDGRPGKIMFTPLPHPIPWPT